jgi:RES domain-containing protein
LKVYRLVHDLALSKNPPFRPSRTLNRWNTDQTVIAYASDSLALAAWETLTYWNHYDTLHGYRIFTYRLENTEIENLAASSDLDIGRRPATQRFGDTWALEQRSPALRVPSLRLPASFNYLINPEHPDFHEERIQSHGPLILDDQIKNLLGAAGKQH